ncbi:MAG: hypothetical protein IT335_02390 [Thermomicrobiales bacterium]|nr:hypothetical protein [Thermomicrobiales bacterium]
MTLRRLALLVLALATILALLPAPVAVAQSPSMSFAIEDGVDSQDADFVIEGLILAEKFFETQIGAIFDQPFQVRVRAGGEPDSPGLLAYWNGRQIVVLTGSPAWKQSLPAERIATIVHEFTHVYQSSMVGFNDNESPAWFEEGVAEYLCYALLDQIGVIDHADLIAFDTAISAIYMEDVPVEQIRAWGDFQGFDGDVYALSHAAVARLMDGKPLNTLSIYYTMLRNGYSADAAFSSLFGATPAAFSDEMTAYIAGWDQPYNGAIMDDFIDGPVEQPSPIEVVSAPVSVTIGEQIVVTGIAQPASVCTLDINDPGSHTPLVERSSFADGTGDVFWLVTIPESVVSGLITIQTACGAAPETRAAIVGT